MKPGPGRVDSRYSAPNASAPEWNSISASLASTEVYALTTLLPDGTPHTVPVAGTWNDEGFWFCTGEDEQKARNIAHSSRASMHVGSISFMSGMDIVVRGKVAQRTDSASLTMLADALHDKYPDFFRFSVTDGALLNAHGNRAALYCLRPEVAHVFTRGEATAQTKYVFDSNENNLGSGRESR